MDPLRLISQAAARLAAGGLVAFPTETVYGLGADAFCEAAVRRVFAVKGRPPTNPLIVHVTGPEMAREVAGEWSESAQRLADVFWPGPLTLIVPKANRVPGCVTGGGPTVAVRAPDHPVAMALIEAFGGPIVGPSANPSGYVSPTRADHVRAHFDADEVLVLEGGPCRTGIESTVLELIPAPAILRRGVVGAADIGSVLGQIVGDEKPDLKSESKSGGPAASPGVLGAHYQPRGRVILCQDPAEVESLIQGIGGKAAILSGPGCAQIASPPHRAYTMPASASEYAGLLYAVLREADDWGASAIIVVTREMPPADPIWSAVLDRLSRASK